MILDSPIISGSLTQQSGQIAEIPRYTAVSSSFLAASASFDARIDSIESTTASLSPRINALESFTASANGTYVNASGDSMSGGLTITGSLIVTDRITAQEFHTEYVSSSVIFQSGSTKFGDSGDDIHSFTGSLQVDGNVIASNLNGIFSSSAQLTSSLGNYFIISGTITQTTWDNIENKPYGIVSGSSQVVSLLPVGVVSGSSQITYSNISSIPANIVSGAAQVTESLDIRYRLVGDDITFAELTSKPTLISGSSQLNGTTIQNLSGSFSGSFSGSYRGDGSGLTGLAGGAKFHTQTQASSTWTFIHNLSTQYPNVTVYDSNNNIVLPQSITATNVNTLVLQFGSPVAGYATAGVGGIIEVNGRTIKQYFTSSLNWRFEHNFGDRFATIQTYDSVYEKVIPQTIALTDATSSLITFPEVTEGWAIGTIGGDLPSISSSFGGYVLQVSNGAPYTASWTPAANVLVTNALTASHLNSFSQSLIPAESGAYDLGSVAKPFRHIYVGTGSIFLVDNTGTITKTLSGDTIVTNDNLSSLNAFTASNFTTNTFTSSASARLNSIETVSASNIARLNSIETVSASNIARLNSIETVSASNISRLSALETTSASVDTLNTTQNTRLDSLEIKTGSLATTGSNTFIGTQTITGSLFISSNLIVQGTSSLQNITASAVSIGTNIINLNTANPAIRYAGLVIGDSGSVGGSGSFLYDSVQDEMIFVHRGASSVVTSSVTLMGPETYDNVGNETYLTANRIPKGTGNEHLVDSCIFDNGTATCFNTPTGSFSGILGIGITNPKTALHVSGTIAVGEPSTGWGRLSFDGSTNNVRLQVSKDGTDSIGLSFWTQASGGGFAERMIISGSNVGINCSTPSYNLDVSGCGRFYQPLTNSTSYLVVQNNRARNAAVYTATTNGGFYTGTSIGTDTFNYQIYDGVAGQARLTISSTGITNFSCQICSPQFAGGFVCAVGGLNVKGASTTWSTFNIFPDNPGAGGDQCKTVLAGSIVGCTGHGPQLRFSGPAAGFIDIGQDCNGAFVIETTDTPRLRVHQCGAVQIGEVAYKSYLLSDTTIQTPVPILRLDRNSMYEIEYSSMHYGNGLSTNGWRYVKWHGYDGSGNAGQGGGCNFYMQVIQCTGTAESSSTPSLFGCVQDGRMYICYGNGYASFRQLNVRRLINDGEHNIAFV